MTTGTEADKPSDRTGSGQNEVVSSGQIADINTLRTVLQAIAGNPSVENGVLRILSKDVRGHIGIQKGMHITGAHVTSTGERGRVALVKLLSAGKGLYAFLSLPEKQPELQQSFNLTIGELLNWHSLGAITDTPPALSEAIESMLSHEAATIDESPAMSAEHAASSQLVQDTEAEFASWEAWGGDLKPSSEFATLGSILGKKKTTNEQKAPVEQIPMPVEGYGEEQGTNGQSQEISGQHRPAPPPPPLMPPPPPRPPLPAQQPSTEPAQEGYASAPEMPPPSPPQQHPSAPRFTDDASVAIQPPEMPPTPPPASSRPPQSSPAPMPQQQPQEGYGTMPEMPPPPPQAGSRPPLPTADPQQAGSPAPLPTFSTGTPHNQTTSGRWKRADLDPTAAAGEGATAPPIQPFKPSQQLRGISQSPPDQPEAATQTQEKAKPKPSDPAMEKRTSQRMQMLSTPTDTGYVAPIQEAKGISKDVIIGGAVGVGLLLLLASQSFQALAYKNHFEDGVAALKADPPKNDVAVVEFSSSISANPYDGRAYFFRALAEARMNNHKAALDDYNKVLAIDPRNLKALVSRATLYNRTKQYDAAIMDCDKAIQIDPGFLDAYRVRAVAYNQSGRYSEALADSKHFLDTFKSSSEKTSSKEMAEVAANRAYANYNKKQYDAAIADYTTAIKADPENGQLYASRAVVYKQVHDWKKAMDDTNKAISLEPGDTSLFKIRGICYAGLGEEEKAAEDLNNLVKYNPSVENHRMRGQARLEVHDFQGAMEDFDFVLGAKPHDQDARAKYQAARLGLQGTAKVDSMVADAAPTKHEAINLRQPEPALVKRGYELMLSGDSDDAQRYLAEAVKRTPNDSSARRYLAYTLIEAGENGEAVDQFSALAKMETLPPGDMLMYAKALNDAKQPEQAIQVYNNILTADLTNDRARTELIKVYATAGDKDHAIKLAQEGMQASPGMKDSYQELIKKIQDQDKDKK